MESNQKNFNTDIENIENIDNDDLNNNEDLPNLSIEEINDEEIESFEDYEDMEDELDHIEEEPHNDNVPMEEYDYNTTPPSHSEYPDFRTDGEIYSIALLEKKGILAIGDGEDTTYFFDLLNKTLIKKEKINSDSVSYIKITADSKYIICASMDGSVNIFDAISLEKTETVNGSYSEISWLDCHPKGPVFGFGCLDGSVWIYHAANTSTNMSFFGHTDNVTCGAFSPDGKYLVSASEDCSVRVWDLKNNKCAATVKGKRFHSSSIASMALAQSKSIVATGSFENEIGLANYETGTILHVIKGGEAANSMENLIFCNEDKYLLFGGTEMNIQLLDLGTMQIRFKMLLNNESVSRMVLSKKSPYLVHFSTNNGNFCSLDVRGNGKLENSIKLHRDIIMDFALTEDENYVITSSLDKTINLHKFEKLI